MKTKIILIFLIIININIYSENNMKKIYLNFTKIENDIEEVKSLNIESLDIKKILDINKNQCLFYQAYSNQLILKDGNKYNYIEINEKNKNYKIINEVSDLIIYDEYFIKQISPSNKYYAYLQTENNSNNLKLKIDDVDGNKINNYNFKSKNIFKFWWINDSTIIISFNGLSTDKLYSISLNIENNRKKKIKGKVIGIANSGEFLFIKNNKKIFLTKSFDNSIIYEFENNYDEAYLIDKRYALLISNSYKLPVEVSLILVDLELNKIIYSYNNIGENIEYVGYNSMF